MKLLGIIGGTGPESTVEYYRALIASYREVKQDGHYPHLLINSIDNKKMLDLIQANRFEEVTAYLVEEVKRLAAAGAEVGLLSANTSHIVFNEVSEQSPIPLISIVEATCAEAKHQGVQNAGLFGTRFTMQGRFYPEVFNREGIKLTVPTLQEQEFIHDKYLGELLNNIFLETTRKQLLAIVDRLREEEHIDALILGGTELPLLLRDTHHAGIPLLNTAKIHVKQAVKQMLE